MYFQVSLTIGQLTDTIVNKAHAQKSDTIFVKLVKHNVEENLNDWQKNMPWIIAFIIGSLTVIANIIISKQARKSMIESLNRQLSSSAETTDKQLNNSKEIAISQIENSRKIVQLDFNKTVLSGNRQTWINTLRDAISDYIAKSNSYRIKLDQIKSLGKKVAQNTDNNDLTEILRLETKIVLMLNSSEDDSKALIKSLGQYTTALFDDTTITQKPEFYQQEIIDVTKIILKKEWERVKKGV